MCDQSGQRRAALASHGPRAAEGRRAQRLRKGSAWVETAGRGTKQAAKAHTLGKAKKAENDGASTTEEGRGGGLRRKKKADPWCNCTGGLQGPKPNVALFPASSVLQLPLLHGRRGRGCRRWAGTVSRFSLSPFCFFLAGASAGGKGCTVCTPQHAAESCCHPWQAAVSTQRQQHAANPNVMQPQGVTDRYW